ncbi:MAG: TonB-dependent receptor [Candidatus Accumulibacter sp.]|nr:TonB-dependent receptor [Accumulibacter sp.]
MSGLVSMLAPGPVRAAEAIGPAAGQEYAIPAGRLSDVLAQFAATAGVPLSFDPRMLTGLNSEGLRGRYGVREGFSRLLAGSAYEVVELGGGDYSLRPAPQRPAAPITAQRDEFAQLEPVTVTAKLYGARETNTLSDSRASVGIVTAEEIRDGQIQDFRQAFRLLGNVMDGATADNGFIIRGINSEGLVPGGAPLASLYIDGVQQTVNGARRGARGLWDVEQMEIYRGPQSTLSGRQALAGAIYVKTKDPSFRKEAEISATAGNHNLAGTAFLLNAPFHDNQLAVRVSGEFQRVRNDINYPTFKDFKRYDEFRTDEYYQLRGKVLFLPSAMPNTQALLSYSFSHDNPYTRSIGGPGYGFRFRDKRGDYQDPGNLEYRPTDVHNAGLEISHDISDKLRFTSMTSFSYSDMERASPNLGTAGEVSLADGYFRNRLASQEFRLNHDGERLRWVAGVYAAHEKTKGLTVFERDIYGPLNLTLRGTDKSVNLAAFGEATYEFAPTWKFTAGGRVDYSKQKNRSRSVCTSAMAMVCTTVIGDDYSRAADFNETNFVPKIGLSKDLTDQQTIGVTFSKGFRTGGVGYDNVEHAHYTYDPEKASTYELFYKGRFLDGRFVLNSNLFHTRYTDQQVEMQTGPSAASQRTFNAASSKSWGFEIEPSLKVTNKFSTFLSLGYVHTRFQDFNTANYGDLSGLPFPEAPKWTIGLGGNYTFDNGFHVGADAKYSSRYLARLSSNLPHDYLGSRWIANLQAGYKNKANRWEVKAFVENLFDKEYFVYNDNDRVATLGEPRRIGVNFTLGF